MLQLVLGPSSLLYHVVDMWIASTVLNVVVYTTGLNPTELNYCCGVHSRPKPRVR